MQRIWVQRSEHCVAKLSTVLTTVSLGHLKDGMAFALGAQSLFCVGPVGSKSSFLSLENFECMRSKPRNSSIHSKW